MTDHYSTLGVDRSATADEIKRAYRRLASQHHPDKGGNKEQFQRVQQAYDVLGDAQKRAQYDNPSPFGPGGQQQGFPGSFHFNFGPGGFNFNDIFDIFGQHRGHQQKMMRMSLWIKLYDVAVGGRRTVSVASPQGSSTVEIDIPVGINDGDTVRYAGIAPDGSDLAVQFRIHPDEKWTRDGLNLITEESVSIWDLILGATVSITHITGSTLAVTVPPRTQPRNMLRLRGHGITANGDLFVRINVKFPENINAELIEAIKKYRD